MDETIKEGQYIVVQRRDFTKLIKVTNQESTIQLGKDVVELKEVLGQKFYSTFKMKFNQQKGKQSLYSLELCSHDDIIDWKNFLHKVESGVDNRNIKDDGNSQTLSNDEINNMKTKVSDSKEMIETLVANNKTFNEKTEFSQEKYLRKKDKKYHEFLQIRKPTIRLITDIFYRQTPEKTLGLRVDSLSQLISYSGVNSSGTYLVYDAGTGGLIPAVFLNSIGSSGDGRLIHLIPGNSSQMQGVDALNLTPEHAKKCLTVNIYSTLRNFYQGTDTEFLKNRKRKAENGSENGPAKRQNLDENVEEKNGNEVKDDEGFKIPKWYVETEEAVELLKKKVDSLVVVSKEDPFNIVKELLQFVNPGRPVVIFHTCKETLMETYMSLKSLDQTLNFRLISNWMRNYQVLPMRTHPEVQINGTSGYLLHGYTKK